MFPITKAPALLVALVVIFSPPGFVSASDSHRVKIKTQLSTGDSAQSQTTITRLEVGIEKEFGSEFPKLKVLVLPIEDERVPLQFSLIAEDGQVLGSTIVYFLPEIGAEFSLDAEGVDVQGQVMSLTR